MVPSMRTRFPVPCDVIHAHTIRRPPPYLTVGIIWFGCMVPFGCFQIHLRPSAPNRLIFDSSEKTTRLQSSIVQNLCLSANCILWTRCRLERNGFFFFTTAL